MPLAQRNWCFPGPKWLIFNKHYQLDERDLCQPESQLQPIFAIPFCDELLLQQTGYQIKSIQTKKTKTQNPTTGYEPCLVGKLWYEQMSSESKVKKDF